MFYGLAHREEDFYKDNVHKVLAFAPCGPPSPLAIDDYDGDYYEEGLFNFVDLGIHFVGGERWLQHHFTICG